jgi:hypothetical protein
MVNMKLQYQDKVPSSYRDEFVKKVQSISSSLSIDPNWLMAIMFWESAGTFSPSVQNKTSGATGLIQFMPSTATGLGTSTTQLKSMSAVQQLDYVYKYYLPYKGKIKNYVDTYFVTFFPLAIGKPDSFVLETKNISASLIARQNPAFDVDKNGKVQVWEVKKVMLEKLPKEWLNNGSISLAVKSYKPQIIIGILLIGAGVTLYYKYGRTK